MVQKSDRVQQFVCACMLSLSVVSNSLQPHRLLPTSLLCPWDFPGKNTGVGCHFLLQGIFLTQGSNFHLLHWQSDSLLLCHLGSPWTTALSKGYHKQMGFSFKEQNTNWEGKMFPVVHTWATHPTISSLSVPKCWFLAPTAKLWGTQCRSREFWREDPQDKWSWQLLGPYAKIPQAGLVGHK